MLNRQNKGSEVNQLNPLDAVTADPDHHRILFENERVRVLDARIGPGETTPVHTHQWPGVLYVLNWSDIVRRDTEGNVLLDTRKSNPIPHVLGTGPVPSFSPPYVPVGPVVGGVGNMTPGGFI